MRRRAALLLVSVLPALLVVGACSDDPDPTAAPDPDSDQAIYLYVTTDDAGEPAFTLDGNGTLLGPRAVQPSDIVTWPYVATAILDADEVEQVRAVLDEAGLLGESPPELVAESDAAAPDTPVTSVDIETGGRIWSHLLVPGDRLSTLVEDLDEVFAAADRLTVPPPALMVTATPTTSVTTGAATAWPYPTAPLDSLDGTCALEGDLAVAVAETLDQADPAATYVQDDVVYDVFAGPVVADAAHPLPTVELCQG